MQLTRLIGGSTVRPVDGRPLDVGGCGDGDAVPAMGGNGVL